MKEISKVSSIHLRRDNLNIGSNKDRKQIKSHMAMAVAHLCKNTPITKVVAITKSGYAARALSLLKISQPIIAISDNISNARKFNLYPGTTGFFLNIKFSKKSIDHIILSLKKLWEKEIIHSTDIIVVIGLSYPKSGNRFNHIQLHSIEDLVETLGWKKKH